MEFVDDDLRKRKIVLKVKPGASRGGAHHLDAAGVAAKAVSLFASAPSSTMASAVVSNRGRRGNGISAADLAKAAGGFDGPSVVDTPGLMSRWQTVGRNLGKIARIRTVLMESVADGHEAPASVS